MVVHGGGKRHQHAADTGGAQLCKRGSPGTAHHQIGPRIGRSHVGDKGFDAGVDAGLCIRHLGFGAQLFAALMANLDIRMTECGQRCRHRLIQHARALASAQHQDAYRAGATDQTVSRRRQCSDFCTHWVAYRFFASKAARKAGQHAARETRQHLVCHARCAILFVHQQRRTEQARSQPARTGSKAAKTDHRTRLALAQHKACGAHCAHYPQRRAEQLHHAFAAQAGDGQRIDRNVVLRHQAGFHRAIGTQPGHRHAARAQHLGYGQSRENMPTGAAGQNHHRLNPRRWMCGRLREMRINAHAILPNVGSTRGCMRLVPRRMADAGATWAATGAAAGAGAAAVSRCGLRAGA